MRMHNMKTEYTNFIFYFRWREIGDSPQCSRLLLQRPWTHELAWYYNQSC